MDQQQQKRDRVEWEYDVKIFERDGIVITVSRLPLKVPQYSWHVMSKGKDEGKLLHSVKADFQGRDMPIVRKGETLKLLVTEAEDWIEQQHFQTLHELEESRAAREAHGPSNGNGHVKREFSPMRKGKTHRDRERRSQRRERG